MRFLLIPGAGGMAWYWYRVVALLQAAGHEAVAVDFPGDDESAGLPEYVELAVAAASSFSRPGPLVVVGQSLGGFSAPIVAERLGAERVVLLNAMIPAAGETAGSWWQNAGSGPAREELDRQEGREPGGFDVGTYFLHDVPAEVLATATEDVRQEADTAFRAPFPDPWPDVPVVVVGGRDDRLFPVAFQRRLAAERLGLELVEIPGGHLAALSHPEEFVAVLLGPASGPVSPAISSPAPS